MNKLSLYEKIKRKLDLNVECRNSDLILLLELWKDWKLFDEVRGKEAIMVEELKKREEQMYSIASVIRARQKVQKDFPILKATQTPVIKARRQQGPTKSSNE